MLNMAVGDYTLTVAADDIASNTGIVEIFTQNPDFYTEGSFYTKPMDFITL